MDIQVVIGAGFGDEAKGLTTDALAHRALAKGSRACVVRFNGGAQAGHTVQLPDGHRHVFHHFGAGSFSGAATHLGQHFVVHPMLFGQELTALMARRATVDITIDPRAPLTFPCDVAINQAIEISRGVLRHGSCGVGFGEAVHRNETGHPIHRLSMGQLADLSVDALHARWKEIASTYVPQRLAALGLPANAVDGWDGNEVFERFVSDCQSILSHATLAIPALLPFRSWILEGAQGLALDEDLGAFPFVTRSKTGLPWALEFIQQLGVPEVTATVWYLTRAYATRHGAGPFAGSGDWLPPGFSDQTNQPNAFQGSLRLAPLNPVELGHRIQQDLLRSRMLLGRVHIKPALSVSCLDQMGDHVPVSDGRCLPTALFAGWLGERLGSLQVQESWGPTRTTWRASQP